MSFFSRLMSWLMHLPPAHTHDLVITRDINIPMPDGVVLLADHYAPRNGSKLPTLLVRSPYGRRGLYRALTALPYAERGYQVLIQSCRGTAGSGGQFLYARHEHDDGLATIAWIKQQDWFSGELATAYHFRKGERLRVQVSSGAHPRFVRNLGSGEPLATGTKLCVAEQTVYHDPEHPSTIVLPVLAAHSRVMSKAPHP